MKGRRAHAHAHLALALGAATILIRPVGVVVGVLLVDGARAGPPRDVRRRRQLGLGEEGVVQQLHRRRPRARRPQAPASQQRICLLSSVVDTKMSHRACQRVQ